MSGRGVESTPLSVLVVGTRAPTIGGITSVIDDQVEGLVAQGVAVTTYNTGARHRDRPGGPTWENVRWAVADGLAVWCAARAGEPSVVAVHTVGSPTLPLARCLLLVLGARAARRPVVVHIHAFDLESSLSSRPFRVLFALLGRLATAVAVLFDRLVEPVRSVVRCPVVVLPNGVDTVAYAPAPVVTEGRPADERGPVKLVFVGTVGRRKGVDDLLRAVRMLPSPVHLVVIGDAAEESAEAYEEVRRAGADLVEAGTVRFIGSQSRAAIRDELHKADVFVLPSLAEGMPMALLEAMACSLPVVVTDVGSMGTIVRETSAGEVVPAGDPRALSRALTALIDHPDHRWEAGQAARQGVVERFDRDLVITELIGIYRQYSGRVRA